MDMIRQRLGLSLCFYSRIDGALFCVFTFCKRSWWCLECCFVGDLIAMKNEASFARKDLHGCFCYIAIDERILRIRLQMVRRSSKWIFKANLHFSEGTSRWDFHLCWAWKAYQWISKGFVGIEIWVQNFRFQNFTYFLQHEVGFCKMLFWVIFLCKGCGFWLWGF
jgi:hypothetical protein